MHKKQQLRDRCNCHDNGTHWDFEFHSEWCKYVIWCKAKLERHHQRYLEQRRIVDTSLLTATKT